MTETNPSTPVTSGDVARHAKVSQSAVSRAFTPGASISQKMREKILKSAAELGYRPNALARAMISGKSGLIAMLVAYLDNQFYPIMLEQISRKLQQSGYQVLLFMTDPGDQDEVVSRILQYQVEGIVMASATLSSELARECARTGIPVVLFNRYVATSPASSVVSDNIAGGRLIADYLVRGGHQRIAFIAGAEDSSTNRDREAGFYHGLAEHGQTVFERMVGGYSFDGAANAARELCNRPHGERPDAIFVANDHMAFSVMDVIRDELGLRVPKDVSVIGYDDVPQAAWKAYDLTTVSQAGAEMIDATARLLLEQIETGSVHKKAAIFPAKLVARSSARRPSGG
ncbi:MAG: LacI family DNA-binding transcriptional regulator [Hoeflea sp.]|uniref:LacI family DNA-binding transcriptional regulator n=1 Tax=Hoeflea sp. TaxID=1940281 RepID=UPI0032EC8E39